MNAYEVSGWANLFTGTVSASAALTGLIFVGISINLDKIVALSGVAELGLEAIVLLFGVLVMSIFVLIPQPRLVLGVEMLVASVCEVVGLAILNVAQWRLVDARFRTRLLVHIVLGRIGVLFFAAAGMTLMFGVGGGLYWAAPALIFSLGAAVYNAWVLLIEIVR